MPVTLVRPADIPTVAVRPVDRASLHITGTVVHVHLTGERPLVFFDDYSTWIGDEIADDSVGYAELITEASVQLITETGVQLMAESVGSVTVGDMLTETGDSLLTESGDHVMVEET